MAKKKGPHRNDEAPLGQAAPRQLDDWLRLRKPLCWRFDSSPGDLKTWVLECANTQEPATVARIRGTIAPWKAIVILRLLRALEKEPAVNTLRQEKKIQVLNALIEGCSIRSIERMTGVHHDTIVRLLVEPGGKCQRLLGEKLKLATGHSSHASELHKEFRHEEGIADHIWTWQELLAPIRTLPPSAAG
jgi:hypothetical protein